MSNQQELIDRIVREVLKRFSTSARTVQPVETKPQGTEATLNDAVVTADLLTERVNGAATILIGAKSIVTPSAWDLIRSRNLIVKRLARENSGKQRASDSGSNSSLRLIVVDSTSAIEQITGDAISSDCPDDAAELAAETIRERRGETAVVFAVWSHRVAMLANRHDKVRAAAIDNAVQVRPATKQIRPNVWCIDPRHLSYYELRNLLLSIERG